MNSCDIIIPRDSLDITDTLECGQVFRYQNNQTNYSLWSGDKKCILYYSGNNTIIESNDTSYFHNYFDLDTDYTNIKRQLIGLPFMREAIPLGAGIRILRQQPFETIISFIISANNHIPRIKSIIERLSQNSAFPSADTLSQLSISQLRDIGLGFRDRYVHSTANAIASGEFDIDSIYDLDSDSANAALCKLLGVGSKVADCILLFGYHRMNVFPVDTWVKKIYSAKFGGDMSAKNIRANLILTYKELSGYAQQYLFYGARSKNYLD